MDKKTLTTLFAEKMFQIPDYQRGYAWEEKQWNDFIQDVDALVNNEVRNHYTGTVVTFQSKDKPVKNYGVDRLDLVDIVDGQQRLTTCCLYLSIIINSLIKKGLEEYKAKIPTYLYSGNTCKLILGNDTKDFFYDLLAKGYPNHDPETMHQKRLFDAYQHFKGHIEDHSTKEDDPVEYLKSLFDAIVRKLNFTFYTIEEECEIGMTFELMNSRGKGLSILELLKNYLMYWVSRNGTGEAERNMLTGSINKNWKEIYANIGKCGGSEDQCLRVAWTLYCAHTPKYWKGYEGFKGLEYIPLRDFSERNKEETKNFILEFSDGLAEISRHYAIILRPKTDNTISKDELVWLNKIHNTGNIANFLPLLIATRINYTKGLIPDNQYIRIIQVLECYAYRVFLFERRRSNAGITSLYRWGKEVLQQEYPISDILAWMYETILNYSSEKVFIEGIEKPFGWYWRRRLLRYTLFEYELHLLEEEGKGQKPRIEWKDLSDSTIEHILPQNPESSSDWRKKWSEEDIETYLHDLGNLVLTVNNSHYLNFEFERKKGKPGEGYCYANSDIRQERKLASYPDWTVKELNERRNTITEWINERWGIKGMKLPANIVVIEDENDDE